MPDYPPQPIDCLQRKAFTLVELIATLAIIALLVAVLIPFIGGMFSSAQQTRDRQTLAILNDALTRYKCEGGDVNALTSSAPIASVIARLQTDTTWAGMTHSFLQKGKTYISRSIYAKGEKHQYRFTKYDTYTAETGGTSPTSLTNGLVGYWKLDAANGATDLSGNGNNGTAQGGLTFGTVANHKGQANGATSLDGASYYIDTVNLSTTCADITKSMSYWVNIHRLDHSSSQYMVYIPRTAATGGFTSYIPFLSSRTLRTEYRSATDTQILLDWTAPIGFWLDTWHHVALVQDGANVYVYVDGVLRTSASNAGTPVPSGSVTTKIGADLNGSGRINADMSDVRIYNRALSAAEVLQLYQQ